MKDTEFLFSSCAVKSLENSVLDKAFYEQMINLPDYDSLKAFLIEKGLSGFEKSDSCEEALSDYLCFYYDEVKELLKENSNLLDFIIIKNDFHNLKASLKLAVSPKSPKGYFILPSLYPAEEIFDNVRKHNFEDLPLILRKTAENAWDILKNTLDGQKTEFYIDRISLDTSYELAEKTGNDFCKELCLCENDMINLKMLLRLSDFSENEALFEDAFARHSSFSNESLIKAVRGGKASALDFIADNCDERFKNASESGLKEFEKLCDNEIFSVLDKTKLIPFGAEVIIAYYMARVFEYKNLSTAVAYKKAGFDAQSISERLRNLNE